MRNSESVRLFALVLLSSTLVILAGPGTASACSCASADPVAAAAAADVVFTGSLVGHEGGDFEPVWTFTVDGWVKGDVPGAELVVHGQDDLSQDDLGQDDLGQDDLGQDDLSQDDLSQDDLSQDDLSQDDLSQDDGASDSGGGIAWPVVIIGGLVIVAGLFALRGEFQNLRRRRAERAERP